MSGITAAATAAAGGFPNPRAARPQTKQKKAGWRSREGTLLSAPHPTPLLPLASRARVPVLLRLHHRPPVRKERTQPPPVWTQLARAFCKRWYCPDCLVPLLFPSSFPASLPSLLFFLRPSSSTFLWPPFPLPSFLICLPPTLFLLRRGTVRYL